MVSGATPACLIAVFLGDASCSRETYRRVGTTPQAPPDRFRGPPAGARTLEPPPAVAAPFGAQPESSVPRRRSCLRPRELSVARTAAARVNPHRRHAGPPIQTSECPCRRGGSQHRPDPRTREPADSPRRRSSNDGAPAPAADPLTLQSQDCGGSGRRRGPPPAKPVGAAVLMPSPTAPPAAHRRNSVDRLARSSLQVRLRNEGESSAASAGRTPTRFWLIRPAA